MNPEVTKYMREMQARSAKSRWSGLTAAEKSGAMKNLRAKGKQKPKRALRRSNINHPALTGRNWKLKESKNQKLPAFFNPGK